MSADPSRSLRHMQMSLAGPPPQMACRWLGHRGCAILREVNSDSPIAEALAVKLRAAGLDGIAFALLEGVAPLAWVGAQAAYLAEPLFGGPGGRLHDMARLLEDPAGVGDLLDRLRPQEHRP